MSRPYLLVLLLLGLTTGCRTDIQSRDATELVLRVDAAQVLRAAAASLELVVFYEDEGVWKESDTTEVDLRMHSLPIDVPLLARAGLKTSDRRELVVRLRDQTGAIVGELRRLTSFVSEQTRVMHANLTPCLAGVALAPCQADETCHGESCLSCEAQRCERTPSVPGESLPTLQAAEPPGSFDGGAPALPGDAGGSDAAELRCESEGVAMCLQNAVHTCKAGTWTLEAPCSAAACVDGACIGVCEPGQGRCTGLLAATAERCSDRGQWTRNSEEGSGGVCQLACAEGRCTDRCTDEGALLCSAVDDGLALQCRAGVLEAAPAPCPELCKNAQGCVRLPSCIQDETCGNESCCAVRTVPGGTFKRSFDGVEYTDDRFVARVSDFRLDRFEVTVSRFRQWVDVYDKPGARPSVGDGKVPDPRDQGWQASWDQALPADAEALRKKLRACGAVNWTDSPGAREQFPVDCVDWYMAFAFCVWDRGRLPTEAEWNYAAAGGDQQRMYPWAEPGKTAVLDDRRALYGEAEPAPVGSRSPDGDGRWGHADLVGSLFEWTRDAFREEYAMTVCDDCADVDDAQPHVIRGGALGLNEDAASVSVRESQSTEMGWNKGGLRCARSM